MKIKALTMVSDATSGWLQRKFGNHVAQISVETKLKLRMAAKDVARQQRGYVAPEIEALTKKFSMPPQGVDDLDFILGYDNDEGHQQGAIETDEAIQEYVRLYPQDWEIVQQCLGLARGRGRHPCGYVVANEPIEELIPLTTVGGVRVTAYNAPAVEAVGGLKMDFLTVSALADVGDALKIIQKRHPEVAFREQVLNGVLVPRFHQIPVPNGVADIWDLPEDQAVFEDISQGRTETVFQLNTESAIKWLKHFNYKKPNGNHTIDSILAIAAFTALDRPGPLEMYVRNPDEEDSRHNMLVEYARRARGATPSPDMLPIFDKLVPETYSVMCFQEQLQRVYQDITGCTGAEAEEFRSNVAKKKKAKVDKAYRPFIEAATKKLGAEQAEQVWAGLCTWARYGFGKSHAVSYSTIAYATAYLKHHYPLEWWTAVLGNASKNEVSEKFWKHCGKFIRLPDVTKSGAKFTIDGNYIQAPLNVIKGVGDSAHQQLSKYAPYTDILDFCRKIEKHRVDGGEYVMEKVKYKDQTNKVLNPETGRMVSTDAVREERSFKRGPNSLNAGVIKVLIASGAMDGLFPEGVSLEEQMVEFEKAMAEAETETNIRTAPEGKTVRAVKPKKVDPAEFNLNPLQRYQSRKAVLPIYGDDLIPLVVQSGRVERLRQYPERALMEWTSPFNGRESIVELISADTLSHQEDFIVREKKAINVAVAAYIEEIEIRKYGALLKEMVKMVLDVEGSRFEVVKFSGKTGLVSDCFRQPLVGAVAIVVLNKWTNDRPFGPEDVIVVEKPLDMKVEAEPEKSNSEETEAA